MTESETGGLEQELEADTDGERPGAIVFCEGAFNTPNGKTAHGLVRRSERWRIVAVIDSRYAGRDAGEVLDQRTYDIPVVADLEAAMNVAEQRAEGTVDVFVIGLAPDGGRLPATARNVVRGAIDRGLSVISGLHDFLGDDPELRALARERGVDIKDVRKPPPRSELHFFTGEVDQVGSFTVALLGTDSAVGKRTTAWLLVDALRQAGYSAELIGTGQTAWMQGAEYSFVLDSLVNDFISGEIEHAMCTAWAERRPDVLVLEGQGSLLNPAYPGGYELLAAGRPDVVILQHAPARRDYDGFPGQVMHPIDHQIRAVEVVSGKPVVAITLNHEGLESAEAVSSACRELTEQTGLPALDVLRDGAAELVTILERRGLPPKADRA